MTVTPATRARIEDRVWSKFPAAHKVRTSDGTRAVTTYVPGRGTTMVPLAALSVPDLFAVYARVTLPIPATA